MAVSVYIPTPFRRATSGEARVDLEATDVKSLLDALEGRYEGLRGLVRDDLGQIHHHVNVYVNGEEIGELGGLGAALKAGDEVSIIPALAGGASG
ncbi:MAG: molybdopterin synthase sulfur carrier subunit [Candidatus Rokuibacteriota bacterium]|jgi:molybdopterin synthase sulfur carrier subunit|nr:MAG: molybdopterin synthase sulfur carrier subunit [Candidatus Rokubacteria bacterium]